MEIVQKKIVSKIIFFKFNRYSHKEISEEEKKKLEQEILLKNKRKSKVDKLSNKYKDVNTIVNEINFKNINNSGFYAPFYYSYLIPFNISQNLNTQNQLNYINLNQANQITF
jgi:hypothetical protein